MHYVISDIHGCYNEYRKALKAIDFSGSDILYVLGDCIDRGYASIKVLQDMMHRPNVIPLIGNHEFMALSVLKELCVEITAENAETYLTMDKMEKYMEWMQNGGGSTAREFQALSADEQADVMDYLGEFSLYEEVRVGKKEFLLVHGGLEPFSEGMSVEDFSVTQILFSRADYDKTYFHDKFTITGHTPTLEEPGNEGTVIKRNHHIAIDCGCVFGGRLAVYCMETDQEIYIPLETKSDHGNRPTN